MRDHVPGFADFSDEDLMSQLSEGCVKAFDELYYRYSGRLMAYFVRMLNYDRDLAEDALQELFAKIAEAPGRFDQSRSFKTWVFSVASNACKNFYRHHQVVKDNSAQIVYEQKQIHENSFALLAAKIDAKNFRQMLEDVLDTLPPEKKEAFILKYQEGKTLAEIAHIQDCPQGSVKSRLHYTLKILEEKLKIFNPVT